MNHVEWQNFVAKCIPTDVFKNLQSIRYYRKMLTNVLAVAEFAKELEEKMENPPKTMSTWARERRKKELAEAQHILLSAPIVQTLYLTRKKEELRQSYNKQKQTQSKPTLENQSKPTLDDSEPPRLGDASESQTD
eukprot:gb/GECG01014021.1/.p1 GENE.gb/GECG01014021.1/~~gb/GECG01014021.1/.p1  ORF type:complete len:135 (+),score=21.92 gb/GECG01014021.1/:1-405(+)